MESRFSPARLAPLLGVSESTLKRWVDAGTLRSAKTVGGHRKIALPDLVAFLRGTGRHVPGFDALGLLAEDPGPARSEGALSPEQFAKLLLDGETPAARTLLLSRFSAGRPLDEILDRLVGPAMAHVGALWATRAIDVYQEHVATQRAWRLLAELRRLLAAPLDDAPLALGGAPEGDPYLLPTLMAELTLRESGWRTLNLGPDVPLASLRNAVAHHKPRLVWLSVTSLENRPMFFGDYPTLLTAAQAQGTVVVLGGQGLTPALQDRLAAPAVGARLAELKAFAVDARRRA